MSSRPAGKPHASRSGAEPALSRGEALVLAGAIAGGIGTALAILPGGYSPFGPAKAFVLLAGVACIALGFALDSALAFATWQRALRQRGVWPALALIAIAALSTATSIDPAQSLLGHYPEYRGLALLLAASVVGLGTYSLAENPRAWRWFGRAAVCATLGVFVYAALQFVGIDPVPYATEFVVRRVRSTSGNASNLGVVMLLLVPIALARAHSERGTWRAASWIAVAGGALTLAWSLSRGAWAGALVGALVWAAVELRQRDRRARLRVIALVAAGAVAALALTVAIVPYAAGRASAALDPSSGTAGWRTEVWGVSARLVGQRPLLGFGPGSFRYVFPPLRPAQTIARDSDTQIVDDPHNLLASTAVASGLIALGALLWLLAEALLAAWRIDDARGISLAGPALAAAVAGAIVALQFHFATLDSAPLLAAAIGLALGLASHATAGTAPPAAARLAARAAAAAACVLALAALAATGGLALADRDVAAGQAARLIAPTWAGARAHFARAEALAPWEPALPWALGRAATQRVSSAHDVTAADDAVGSLEAARRRLPHDPALLAQTAEAYLVVGQQRSDSVSVVTARRLAQTALRLDPENGYRWSLLGATLATDGETQAAQTALERAVSLTPDNEQAWTMLAAMYDRLGKAADAARARAKAQALSLP